MCIRDSWKADRALILERVLVAFAVKLENQCRNRTNATCDRSPSPWPTSSLQKQNPPLWAHAVGKGRTLWGRGARCGEGARRNPATSPNLPWPPAISSTPPTREPTTKNGRQSCQANAEFTGNRATLATAAPVERKTRAFSVPPYQAGTKREKTTDARMIYNRAPGFANR